MILLDRISTMCSDVRAKNKNNNMFYEHATDFGSPKRRKKRLIGFACFGATSRV